MNPPTPFDLVGLGSAGPGVAVDPSRVNEPLREISMEELNRNDGATEGTPIYIAVLGTVYDVSNATKLYGPGKPCGCTYATFELSHDLHAHTTLSFFGCVMYHLDACQSGSC